MAGLRDWVTRNRVDEILRDAYDFDPQDPLFGLRKEELRGPQLSRRAVLRLLAASGMLTAATVAAACAPAIAPATTGEAQPAAGATPAASTGGELIAGWAGTAEITTITRENALLVPNAALRYTPPAATDAAPTATGRGLVGVLIPRPPPQVRKVQQVTANGAPRVWVLRDGEPAAIEIRTGATNGRVTEVVDGPLEAGMQVITESVSTAP